MINLSNKMFLVKEVDTEKNMIISGQKIKRGIYFDFAQEDILCNSATIYDDYKEKCDAGEESISDFTSYLEDNNIVYFRIERAEFKSLEVLEELTNHFDYHYSSETDTYKNSKEILDEYLISYYFEISDGNHSREIELVDKFEEVELVYMILDEKLEHKLEIYISKNNILYEAHISKCENLFDNVKKITDKELWDKYGYKIK